MSIYNPANWYWNVASNPGSKYSSAIAAYVLDSNPTYLSWIADGNIASNINTETELWEVLAQQYPAGISLTNTVGQDIRKTYQINVTDKVLFQIAFNHENRIRTLAGQPNITVPQFVNGVKALI